MRTFETGATRDVDNSKLDYEGFLSPLALEAFATFMDFNRVTAKGVRDSDNWQKGIPLAVYMKSKMRHDMAVWQEHRGKPTPEGLVWNLCAVLFNTQGYLHELLKANPYLLTKALADAKKRRATEDKSRTEPAGDVWIDVSGPLTRHVGRESLTDAVKGPHAGWKTCPCAGCALKRLDVGLPEPSMTESVKRSAGRRKRRGA